MKTKQIPTLALPNQAPPSLPFKLYFIISTRIPAELQLYCHTLVINSMFAMSPLVLRV